MMFDVWVLGGMVVGVGVFALGLACRPVLERFINRELNRQQSKRRGPRYMHQRRDNTIRVKYVSPVIHASSVGASSSVKCRQFYDQDEEQALRIGSPHHPY